MTPSPPDCPHSAAPFCQLATAIAGQDIPATEANCARCKSQWTAGPPTDATTPMLRALVRSRAPDAINAQRQTIRAISRPRGLGDILAAIFARIGIRKRPGCGCARRQATLNRWFAFR